MDRKHAPLPEQSPFAAARQPAAQPSVATGEPAPAPLLTAGAGGQASASAQVLSHYADGAPSALAPDALHRAVAWGGHQHFSRDQLLALQTAAGAPATGAYDEATAGAVAQTQRLHGEAPDGKAGAKTRTALGIQDAPKGATQAKGHVLAAGTKQPPKEGVSVALFNQFNTKKTGKGDLEFERRADNYAKQYQAAGLRNGALAWGKSTPFQGVDGLTSAIQGLHEALVESVHGDKASAPKAEAPGQAGPAPGAVSLETHDAANAKGIESPEKSAAEPEEKSEAVDRSTQIRHLSIFTHGMEYGIDTNPDKHSYRDGLHKDLDRKHRSNIGEFVTNVSGALTPDVSVQLYACSTGRDNEEGKKAELEEPPEGERHGGDSFAAHLAEELQEKGHGEASVFAHINAKHTTENPYARVFGYEADGAEGGKSLFELLYSAEFVDGELLKLVPNLFSRPAEEQEQFHVRMRATMWEHYIDRIYREHQRRDHGGEMAFDRKTYMGMETFQNPQSSAAKLHADFQARLTYPLQVSTWHS